MISTTEFKDTEIGSIPFDWDLATLGELFDIQQGKSVSPENRKGVSPHPFLRTANVLWGRLDLTKVDTMDFTNEEIEKLSLKSGDLLVCEGGDVGRTALWRGEIEKCAFQNHIHRLRARSSEIVPEFYMHWMQAALVYLGLYRGERIRTTIPNLSKGRLSSFVVPKPKFHEQRKIAYILDLILEAIQNQRDLTKFCRELKRSFCNKLFTGGIANSNGKDTEIGPVPEKWELCTMDQLLLLSQYGISEKGEAAGKYPIFRMNNIEDGRLQLDDLQYVNIDAETFDKYRLAKGDVLFNRTNSIELVGKTAFFDLPGDYVFASYLLRLKMDESRVDPKFLSYYINWDATQARLKTLASRAVGQSNISATRLRTFQLPLPPYNEQREITKILELVDAKIDLAEKRLLHLEQLFKSVLLSLMLGHVRTFDLEVKGHA
ncbi:MAG: restriction endonuclease subunit S [Nitrososphaera sp.]|jgi:type I restriction enzyme S subunit